MNANSRNDWFELWFADKKSILQTMHNNMVSDLKAGYAPNGKCIVSQLKCIEDYTNQMNAELDSFKGMSEKQVNRWCFYDLVKRGAIEI